eukprot:m.197328 g.197328  ORF g.197328 m.197328 type:complete len:1630 (+) comp13681_c0_seq7:61-4950(+)
MEPLWSVGTSSRIFCVDEDEFLFEGNGCFVSLNTTSNSTTLHNPTEDASILSIASSPEQKVFAFCRDQLHTPIEIHSVKHTPVKSIQLQTTFPFCALEFVENGTLLYAMETIPGKVLRLLHWQSGSVLVSVDLKKPDMYNLRSDPYSSSHIVLFSDSNVIAYEVEKFKDLLALTPTELDLNFSSTQRQGSNMMKRTSLEESLNLEMYFQSSAQLVVMDCTFDNAGDFFCGCKSGELLLGSTDLEMPKVVFNANLYGEGSVDSLLWDNNQSRLFTAGVCGVLRVFERNGDKSLTNSLKLCHSINLNIPTTAMSLAPGDGRIITGGTSHITVVDSEFTSTQQLVKGIDSAIIGMGSTLLGDKEGIVALSGRGIVTVHNANGLLLSTTDISDEHFFVECFAVAAYVPVFAVGTSTGKVLTFRVDDNGDTVLVASHQVFEASPVLHISITHTAEAVVCASKDTFAVLRDATLSLAMFGRVPTNVLEVHVFATQRTPTVYIVADHKGSMAFISFSLPRDQKQTTDLFFSDATRVEIDFTIAPVNVSLFPASLLSSSLSSSPASLLPLNPCHSLATANHLCIYDNIEGTASFVDPLPTRRPKAQNGMNLKQLIGEAQHMTINCTFKCVSGASAKACFSPSGNMMSFASSQGDVMSVILSDSENMQIDISPSNSFRFSIKPNRQLSLPLLSSSPCWSVDGMLLYVCSHEGVLQCMDWDVNNACRESSLAAIKQAKQYRTVVLGDVVNQQRSKVSKLSAVSIDTENLDDGNSKDATKRTIHAVGSGTVILSKIEELKQQLASLIQQNETASEDEKLSSDEFVLDVKEKLRLESSLKDAVQTKREEIELEMLKEQFFRYNIKRQCWDSMQVQGKRLYGFKSKTEVLNFPIPKLSEEDENELMRTIGIRKVELHREAALKALHQQERHKQEEQMDEWGEDKNSGEEMNEKKNAKDETKEEDDNSDAEDEKQQEEEEEEEVQGGATEDNNESVRKYLYKPLELSSGPRRRIQIVLLKHYVREMKMAFNAIFDEVCEHKRDERQKIASKNEQIEKICAELKRKPPVYIPEEHVLENPEKLLEVSDDEVTVERVLTEEQQRAKEEQERIEAEQRAAAAKDNIRERGIRDMMNGRLEGKSEDDVWIDIPKPDFMINVRKVEWDGDQKREAAAYEKECEALNELRQKRKKALEAHLRTLKTQITTICESFDARLNEVFQERIVSEQTVAREELMMLKLVKTLQDEQDIIDETEKLKTGLAVERKRQPQLTKATLQAEKALVQEKNVFEELSVENKQMEKRFRNLSEFSDLDQPIIDDMYKHYRTKGKYGGHDIGTYYNEHGEFIFPLRPQEVSDHQWKRFTKLYKDKKEFEQKLRSQHEVIQAAEKFLKQRREDENVCLEKLEKGMDNESMLLAQRTRLNHDIEVLMTVTQGQVELHHSNDFDPTFTSAMLVHRSVIETLNEETKKLAKAKIEHIMKKLRLAQGVRLLQWEHKKLDLEQEQLQHLTREVQLLKVTKDTKSRDGAKEVEALEKNMKTMKKSHQKRMEAKKLQVEKLRREIKKKEKKKQELTARVESLASDVGERAHVRQVQLVAVGDGGAKERMDLAQKRHKLVNSIRDQATEIQTLQNELERLRMKTFPSFNRN